MPLPPAGQPPQLRDRCLCLQRSSLPPANPLQPPNSRPLLLWCAATAPPTPNSDLPVLPPYALCRVPRPAAPCHTTGAETAPNLIDERWNILRCDVSSRPAGVVFIQLVRVTTFPGASFPGTMISCVRRAPRLPRLAPRPSLAGSASAPSRPPAALPARPPPLPLPVLPHCTAPPRMISFRTRSFRHPGRPFPPCL